MEFMQGGTLAQAAKSNPMKESQIAYIAREMLKGIQYMHSLKIVHRDLKSANVMLSIDGGVKLIDFGLCLNIGEHGEVVSMVGSPYWIPPEMILQEPHGYEADIWSFAICLLELANRCLPFNRTALKCLFNVAVGTLPSLDHPDQWSREFYSFLDSCLQRDPKLRPTALQLLEHSFLQKASPKKEMQDTLQSIFLGKELARNGLL